MSSAKERPIRTNSAWPDRSVVGRHQGRDRCLLLLQFRHGLRVSEGCRMTLDQVDADSRALHVVRLKHGLSTDHPLRADERETSGIDGLQWSAFAPKSAPSGINRNEQQSIV
jgi:integrase